MHSNTNHRKHQAFPCARRKPHPFC